MAETVREFFERLDGTTLDPAKAGSLTSTYRFDIAEAGSWRVWVEEGTVRVAEDGGSADCTISTAEDTFLKLRSGEQNPMTAYMTGKVKVDGDMGAAMKLRALF